MAELNTSQVNVQVLDFTKVCRTCLGCDGEMRQLFMDPDTEQLAEIRKMIEETTTYPVINDDNLPNNICDKCVDSAHAAYQFKTQCERAFEILSSAVESYQIHKKDQEVNQFDTVYVDDDMMMDIKEPTILIETIDTITDLTHSGDEVEHQCNICDKSFKREVHLRKHMSTIHPDLESLCTKCDKNFSTAARLKKHILTCHKIETKEEEEDNLEIKEKPQCTECYEEFETALDVVNHKCNVVTTKEEILDKSNEQISDDDNHPLFGFDENSSDAAFRVKENDPDSQDDDDDYFSNQNGGKKSKNKNDNSESDDDEPLVVLFNKQLQQYVESENNGEKKRRRGPMPKSRSDHKCLICKKTFSRGTHLRRHFLTHSSEKPHLCKECGKRFARADHLKIHSLKHRVKPFTCSVCERGFLTNDDLVQHEQIRHQNKFCNAKTEFCEICKKGFTTVKYLNFHMKVHSDRKWKCKFCEAVFDIRKDLTEHSKTHVHEKQYLCSICGLRFVRNDYLVIHMRRHKGEKPYKCKFCDKGFPRATDLNVHERYHTGEKTHLCTVCGKGFQRAYNLLVHTRVHTGERPYQCPHCTKSFAQGNDLKSHIRRHTGERIKCEICDEGFIQGYHLTQHKRNVHGIEVESNIRRVEKFITPTEQFQQMEVLRQKDFVNDDQNDVEIIEPDSSKEIIEPDSSKEEQFHIELMYPEPDIKSENMSSNGEEQDCS